MVYLIRIKGMRQILMCEENIPLNILCVIHEPIAILQHPFLFEPARNIFLEANAPNLTYSVVGYLS